MFDHAVFVTYSLTFMMMLTALFAVLIQFSATEVRLRGLMLAFVPPIHLYRHLHHAYETSRFGAFWRMCILSVLRDDGVDLIRDVDHRRSGRHRLIVCSLICPTFKKRCDNPREPGLSAP